ncbi:MAG TPA: hypothetical protein VJ739_02485 [Gemmataceae bacterium]|nr:hypothetical protein [Gemmataceae bacterium]
MARRKIGPEVRRGAVRNELAGKLTAELKSGREYGQPFIYEQEYQTGKLRVTVVWDEWDGMSLQERSATILRGYELAEGDAYRDRVALASGLTVPEAHAAGMLPYEILAALRKGDPVTVEQAWQAMLEEGATRLAPGRKVQLRFATEEEAEACRQRLIRRFPGSEDVWLINREMTAQDFASAYDTAQAGEE